VLSDISDTKMITHAGERVFSILTLSPTRQHY
jgi:hypothetical protein